MEVSQLEERVEAVEKDIGELRADSAVTLKLLTMSLTGRKLTEQEVLQEIEDTKRTARREAGLKLIESDGTESRVSANTDATENDTRNSARRSSTSPGMGPQELAFTCPGEVVFKCL